MTGKRRRTTLNPTSGWESLPEDLVQEIAWRVLAGDLLDYVRLRAVCTRWCSATPSPGGRGVVDPRFHPRCWMMLPEGHGLYPGHCKLRGYIRFFNLRTGAFVRARLPHFKDHCVLDSVDGLLLLQRDHDTAIRLLHPFTGDIAEFPPLSTVLSQPNVFQSTASFGYEEKWDFIRSLCASVCTTAAGATTMLLAFRLMSKLAFATSGKDQQWTMSSHKLPSGFPMPFQGKLYWLTLGRIFQINQPVEQQDVVLTLIAAMPFTKIPSTRLSYLAECNSEILLLCIASSRSSSSSSPWPRIVIYRLADLISERFVPVRSIGDDNCIVINQRSLCVSSKTLPTVTGDTVVYFDGRLNYEVQYNLRTGKSSRAIDRGSRSRLYPGPSSLINHIAGCCIPTFWNKGHMGSRREFKSRQQCHIWMVKHKFRVGA